MLARDVMGVMGVVRRKPCKIGNSMNRLLLAVPFLVTSVFAEEMREKKYMFLGPHPIVVMPEAYKDMGKYDEARELIGAFIKDMQWVNSIQFSRSNPECCIWIEFWHYDKQGIILRAKSSGVHLTVGSNEALKAALRFLKKKMVVKDGSTYFPAGNFSNQPVTDISEELEKVEAKP
jgi:hypothetical protein